MNNRNCLWCGLEFISTNWNNNYCCRAHFLEYRKKYRQRAYAVKYASKTPRAFISRLLLKRRYNKHNLSLDYLEHLYNEQKGLCALSGVKMTYIHGEGYKETNISVDRIYADVGYVPGNVQLVCRLINVMKYTSKTVDFIEWCRIVVDYNTSHREIKECRNQSHI